MFPLRDTIPSRHRPLVTWSLIAVNLAVFLHQLGLPAEALDAVFHHWGVVPARYTRPQWAAAVGLGAGGPLPFLTSMFLHGGLFHVGVNMWTLWIFGDNVEDRMGPWRFLGFYLLSGLVASAVHLLSSPASTVPAVGASGAIAGVLGAYLFLFPHARVLTVVPIFFWPVFLELPAVFYLVVWFLGQLVSGTASLASAADVGGVAWWAHVGGFLAGALLHRRFVRRQPPPPPVTRLPPGWQEWERRHGRRWGDRDRW